MVRWETLRGPVDVHISHRQVTLCHTLSLLDWYQLSQAQLIVRKLGGTSMVLGFALWYVNTAVDTCGLIVSHWLS